LLGVIGGENAAELFLHGYELRDIEAVISIKSIMIAIGFTTLVGIIFGIYPAIKAAKN